MEAILVPHPDRPAPPFAIVATALRIGDELSVIYRVSGPLDRLAIPSPSPPVRAHGLWRHTCFEIFIHGLGSAYLELNFSPSSEWAAYRFSGRRSGMCNAEDIAAPSLAIRLEREMLELRAGVFLPIGDGLPADLPWRIGLSSVIEEKDGTKTYWALAHPAREPDFHHEDCFAGELPPPI